MQGPKEESVIYLSEKFEEHSLLASVLQAASWSRQPICKTLRVALVHNRPYAAVARIPKARRALEKHSQ